jgi:flagellin
MFRVNTNVMSVQGQRFLFSNGNAVSVAMSHLSSGLRILRGADDAAGLAASDLMRGQLASAQQANRNISQAVSMLQTADSGYEQIGTILIRLKELATQASDATLNPSNRSAISLEVVQLMTEIERIAQATTYNGLTLINTTGANASVSLSFYVGEGTVGIVSDQVIFYGLPGVNAVATAGISIGLGGISIVVISIAVSAGNFLDVSQAASAVNLLQRGVEALGQTRSSLGAFVNRMSRAQANVQIMVENTKNANSVIRDADFAAETAALTRAQILVRSSSSMLQQVNIVPQNALVLLQA